MNNVRLQICTGLFRSASNIESFENMLALLSRTARAVGPADAPAPAPAGMAPVSTRMEVTGGGSTSAIELEEPAPQPEVQLPKITIRRELPKVGRNDPCPCGSGKKFKQCHGK